MISNKEVMAFTKLADAFVGFTEAAKSDAGKLMRKEALALEKAAGGAKKLAEADDILAKAGDRAETLLKNAELEVARVVEQSQKDIATQADALAESKAKLSTQAKRNGARTKTLDDRDAAASERDNALLTRENAVVARERKAEAAEGKLAEMKAALKAKQDELEARESRIRAAVG